MTTEVERRFLVDAPIEDIWALIADPALRAEAIRLVDRFETAGDVTTWHLSLPLPALPGTIPVRTRDIERDPPNYVKFVGKSRIMQVVGEHELTETADGCEIRVRFVVDGKFPGVETFFKRNIDEEIDHLLALVADRLVVSRDGE